MLHSGGALFLIASNFGVHNKTIPRDLFPRV